MDRQVEVLIIGAGFAGACAGYEMRRMGIDDFLIVEKSQGVGGVWSRTTYPGLVCDVASHSFDFSFEPKTDWRKLYPAQQEVEEYIVHCFKKFKLNKHLAFRRIVRTATFDEGSGLWEVSVENATIMRPTLPVEKIYAKYVINCTGALGYPHIPIFKGANNFCGPSMHTSEWDHDVDFSDKKISVIGSAASAVQIIPELAKKANRLDIYQRTPNYICPRKNSTYTAEQIKAFQFSPESLRKHHDEIYDRRGGHQVDGTLMDKKLRRQMGEAVNVWMRSQVKDKSLHKALTPDYTIGCKRILMSDNYFSTLNLPNVNLIPHGIDEVRANGIVAMDNKFRDTEIIIYATGYDTTKSLRAIDLFGIKGANSVASVDPILKNLPDTSSYRGVMCSGFPNFFWVTGPNTGLAAGKNLSSVLAIEINTNWIAKCIFRARDYKYVNARPEAQASCYKEISRALEGTVWAENCTSWFKLPDGSNVALYPYDSERREAEMSSLDSSELMWVKK